MSLGELTYQAFAQAISSYAANDIFSLLNYLTFRCDRSSRWIPNKVTVLSWRSSDKHVQSLSVGGASSLRPSFPLPTLLAGLTAAKLGKNFRESPAPVPGKFGPGKKYRYRYRKKLVPEKVPVLVPKKMVPVPENSRELPVIVYFNIFMYLQALGKGNVPLREAIT